MLNAIRKTTSSISTMILMGLLIASFAIWGIGDVFHQSSSSTLATVGSGEITTQAYTTEFHREMDVFKRKLGPSFTPAQAVSLGLGDRVIKNMVARETFLQAANRIGIHIPNTRVANEISNNDAFKNKQGQFDRQTYESLLHSANMNSRVFEENTRQDLARQDLLQTLATSVKASDTLVNLLYTYRKEVRMVRVLTVPASGITVAAPSDADLQKFHQANARLFMAPEYRKLTYLILAPEDHMKEMTVGEDELKEQYLKRGDDFNVPEQRDVEQIVFASEADAKKWYGQIKGGMDFLKAAKLSVGANEADTKLGLLSKKSALEQVGATATTAIFALKTGQISEPVQGNFGWNIFRVIAVKPGEEKTLAEVKDKLTATLKREKAIDAIVKIADKVDDQLASGATINEVAANIGLKAVQVAAVDRQGNGPDGKPIAGMPKISGFLEEAFSADEGAAPVLRDSGDGGYYAVAVNDIIAPVLMPLDKAHDAVVKSWTAEKREQAAKVKAQEIAAKMSEGVDLAAFVKDSRGEFHDGVPVPREDPQNPQAKAPEARTVVYGLALGKAGIAPAPTGDGYIVIQLKSIQPGDPAKDPNGLKDMEERVNGELANDLLGQYQNALDQKYGLEINKPLMKKINAQLAGETSQ